MAYKCWVIAAQCDKLVVTSSKSSNNEPNFAINEIPNVYARDAPSPLDAKNRLR